MILQHCVVRGRQLWRPAKLLTTKRVYPICIINGCASIRILHLNIHKRFITNSSICEAANYSVQTNVNAVLKCNYSRTSNSDGEIWNEGECDKQQRFVAMGKLEDIFATKTNLSDAEWEETIEVASQAIPKLNETTCDSVIIMQCSKKDNWYLGQSYMDRLARLGQEASLSALASYLVLCGKQVDQCGEELVLQVYHKLISRAKVLELQLNKSAVLGVSATREWRRAVSHIESIKRFSQPCTITYSAIITAAFKHAENDIGWQYLDEMCGEAKEPTDAVFLEWLRQSQQFPDMLGRATTLIHKLAAHEIFPTVPVIQDVARFFKENLGWSSHFVRMPTSGQCPSCREQLELPGVSQEEFQQLQEQFVPRVLHRSDIFLSSSPQEWEQFQEFVEAHRPFIAVVDGLNLFYFKKAKNGLGKVVRALVAGLEQSRSEAGRVLVLGRNHMKYSIPQALLTNKQVYLYTLRDLSRDDGFFLYAALQSGWGTKFVTRDLLRDHLFQLDLTSLRITFRRWQRSHQLIFDDFCRLLQPAKYSTMAQGGEGGWHVPYDSAEPRFSYQAPNSWLCLQPPTGDAFSQVQTHPIDEVHREPEFCRASHVATARMPYSSTDRHHHKFTTGVRTTAPRCYADHKKTSVDRDYKARNKYKKKSNLPNDFFD